MRDFQVPGRSTVHAANALVATSHPASTLMGVEILRAGGNAVDAAIAAAAVQAVVEPQSTGIGGDCFVLYAPRGGPEIIGLNGSGHAPAAATPRWFRDNGISAIALDGPHAVTVPGAVDAWLRLLADHGTMSRAQVLAPAIDYARNGFAVQPRVGHDWAKTLAKLQKDAVAARLYLPGGRPPGVGQIVRLPELAATFERIAAEGRDGFYAGAVAEDMVGCLRRLGGLHTLEDFALQSCQYVEPITASYRGYDVHQCPPNGQGIAVLLMLGILEGFDLERFGPLSVERLHLEAEATRLAYHVCEETIGDPRLSEIPIAELLSDQHLELLRSRIRMDRVMTDVPETLPMHPETIYLTVVDKHRNVVSLINSVCFAFGSGLVSPKWGVLLHNRGGSFSLEDGHPNSIGPRKRPRHTIIPGLMSLAGRTVLSFGVMGGQFQPVGQVHVLTNLIDFGLDVQQAIDLGRGFRFGGVYGLERSIPDEVARGLRDLGHPVARCEEPLGSGQAIWIDWENGTLTGGSDGRKDGVALGY